MIDWTKPIETDDGIPCRYLGEIETSYDGKRVVACLRPGHNFVLIFNEDGSHHLGWHTRNVPEKREAWLNCVGKAVKTIWPSRDIADKYATPDRTACIRVEWQDGEGLA